MEQASVDSPCLESSIRRVNDENGFAPLADARELIVTSGDPTEMFDAVEIWRAPSCSRNHDGIRSVGKYGEFLRTALA
ncbi:hypothetical protein [Pandoraea capi]|uniref:hypothetical protein n=1 Tax=Pandoraea capi TaxID=2508286 RepID=UPI00124102DB|nr:hypothetical protein [Pandoraea capi]